MTDNFYGITDTGKMRDNNEDDFIAQNILNGKYIAGCVIDGVGGYEGGEIASATTRLAILSTLKKISGNVVEVLKRSFVIANKKIFDKKKSTGQNLQMACVLTLVIADLNENKFYYAHVGDTRLYLFRDHSLVKISHDHSFVGFLEDSGRITEEAAMQHPKRNEINKALGFDDEKFSEPDYIETGESPFLPGDILLLCSDGLSDMLSSKAIADILSSSKTVKEKCKALINAANVAGGKDNITVVLIENNKSPLQHEATRPSVVKKNEQVIEETANEQINENNSTNSKTGFGLKLFAILFFLALIGLGWFIYKDYFKKPKEVISDPSPAISNSQSKKLNDSINLSASKKLFIKDVFDSAQNLTVDDSIIVQKDSIYINGNGISLVADSAYSGPAITITPNCKYVLIDSVTFENFSTALLVQSNALHLKNVQFKNCNVPVLYALQLEGNKNISTTISDSAFERVDSVKQKSQH